MSYGTYYLNQNRFPQVPYLTDAAAKTVAGCYDTGTVESSACGLCYSGMMLHDLLGIDVPMEQLVAYSYHAKANLYPGTSLVPYAQLLCRKYDIKFSQSNKESDIIETIRQGGVCIANVGGDYKGHIGVFSHGGHYIYIYAYNEASGEFAVLDPSRKEGKYEEEGRKGKVRCQGDTVYCTADILKDDTANRDPGYFLFLRK
ncbi:MAG TPA: hypothetical protein DEP00_02910 [Lachnospiraceae bacterium]|nr:hypothetical protein [Lachnospiraceae bacterium]